MFQINNSYPLNILKLFELFKTLTSLIYNTFNIKNSLKQSIRGCKTDGRLPNYNQNQQNRCSLPNQLLPILLIYLRIYMKLLLIIHDLYRLSADFRTRIGFLDLFVSTRAICLISPSKKISTIQLALSSSCFLITLFSICIFF